MKKSPTVVIKKNNFGDPATVRKVITQFASLYSVAITKEDIDSLIAATRIEAEAKKLGGADKFLPGNSSSKLSGKPLKIV